MEGPDPTRKTRAIRATVRTTTRTHRDEFPCTGLWSCTMDVIRVPSLCQAPGEFHGLPGAFTLSVRQADGYSYPALRRIRSKSAMTSCRVLPHSRSGRGSSIRKWATAAVMVAEDRKSVVEGKSAVRGGRRSGTRKE